MADEPKSIGFVARDCGRVVIAGKVSGCDVGYQMMNVDSVTIVGAEAIGFSQAGFVFENVRNLTTAPVMPPLPQPRPPNRKERRALRAIGKP